MSADCVNVSDIDDEWQDAEIWRYARENGLTIVTKDAEFDAERIICKRFWMGNQAPAMS